MPSSSSCRIDSILEIIGDQWNLRIVHELSAGPRRTLEIHAAFTHFSTRTLTGRLKQLERAGLITRKAYGESPPRVEYSLTDKGRDLLPVLESISAVAASWGSTPESGVEAADTVCRCCDQARPGESHALADPESENPPPKTLDRSNASRNQIRPRKRDDVTLL